MRDRTLTFYTTLLNIYMAYSKGRKLTEDLVRNISSQYNSLTEWTEKDPSSCRAAKRLGIYEELKNTKNIRRESTPQRMVQYIFDQLFQELSEYNYRNVIPPFEIDVYYSSKNFGIEYNGYAFHFGRYNDPMRENRKIEAEQNSPNIFIFHINEDRYYKHSEYATFIKQYIINHLNVINEWCGSQVEPWDVENIRLDNIDYFVPFNWEVVIDLIDSYESGTDFRKNHQSLYHTIISKNRRDILDYINKRTVEYRKKKLQEQNDILIDYVLRDHNTYEEFYSDKPLYFKCNYKRTIIQSIKKLFLNREIENSKYFMDTMLQKHSTYNDFIKDYENHYKSKKLGINDKLKNLFYEKNKDSDIIKWFNSLSDGNKKEYIKSTYKTIDSFNNKELIYAYLYRRDMVEWAYDIITSS